MDTISKLLHESALRTDECDFTDDDIKILAALNLDDPKSRTNSLLSNEAAEYEAELRKWRPAESNAKSTEKKRQRKSRGVTHAVEGTDRRWKSSRGDTRARPFDTHDLIQAVLTPEERVGGLDAMVEALSAVRVVELQDMGIDESSILELLGNMTHLYVPHNSLRELQGLQTAANLTVLVVHHNKLTSLRELAELECLTFIDASWNDIEELDVANHLPCGSLTGLNLIGNPCSPRYDEVASPKSEDDEYVVVYRTEVLRCCPRLRMLDDFPIDTEIRARLGLDGGEPALLTQMTNSDAQLRILETMNSEQAGLDTKVSDADFLLQSCGVNDGEESDDTSETEIHFGDGKGESDDDDVAEKKTDGLVKKSPNRSRPKGPSTTSLTDRLLVHYQKTAADHGHRVSEAVSHSDLPLEATVERIFTHFDPSNKDVDDDDDDADALIDEQKSLQALKQSSQEQTRLRAELRMSQKHHSSVVEERLRDHWDSAQAKLRERHQASLERRLSVRERLSKPSAAYLAALEVLRQEVPDKNIEKYRAAQPPLLK